MSYDHRAQETGKGLGFYGCQLFRDDCDFYSEISRRFSIVAGDLATVLSIDWRGLFAMASYFPHCDDCFNALGDTLRLFLSGGGHYLCALCGDLATRAVWHGGILAKLAGWSCGGNNFVGDSAHYAVDFYFSWFYEDVVSDIR